MQPSEQAASWRRVRLPSAAATDSLLRHNHTMNERLIRDTMRPGNTLAVRRQCSASQFGAQTPEHADGRCHLDEAVDPEAQERQGFLSRTEPHGHDTFNEVVEHGEPGQPAGAGDHAGTVGRGCIDLVG